MAHFLTFFVAVLSITQNVHSHGFVHQVAIGQNVAFGWNPFVDPYSNPVPERVMRKIPSDGPVTDVRDPNLACNGQEPAALTASATAGSTVSFQWEYWPGDHLGPVSTYLTACSSSCTTFDINGASWFKLDAEGYDGQWASAKLMADGFQWNSTVPATLAPGDYIMRHEIIALHSQAPQFYPVCLQLTVTGSGNARPKAQDYVSIPGLYDTTQWPNIYSDFGTFSIPGPAPVELTGDVDSSSGLESQLPNSSITILSGATVQQPTSTQTYSPQPNSTSSVNVSTQCRLVKRKAN